MLTVLSMLSPPFFPQDAVIFLRVKRATCPLLFNKGEARHSTTTYCEAVYRLADTSRSVSVGMRFVTFVKSNAKALLTLRIKSPLRSAEGIGWRGSLCLRSAHFGDSVLHLRLHHASMSKTSSLARMSPYTTSHNSRRYHRPHPPSYRIAIMYLWWQYSHLRSYCPITVSHVRVSIWDARSAHLYTESKALNLSCKKYPLNR